MGKIDTSDFDREFLRRLLELLQTKGDAHEYQLTFCTAIFASIIQRVAQSADGTPLPNPKLRESLINTKASAADWLGLCKLNIHPNIKAMNAFCLLKRLRDATAHPNPHEVNALNSGEEFIAIRFTHKHNGNVFAEFHRDDLVRIRTAATTMYLA
jgi:hypothetical protein